MGSSKRESTPKPGQWPADPQEDVPISPSRIWIDGCFDFTHHGHAGAMLQARRLGDVLLVGVHSDEAIVENKGPTVMTLKERVAAVDACRWATQSIPCAPYVTSLPWISHYGCQYVVHGDDITSDSSGEDCYRYVKAAGRFKVVKRTPGISTTDLVGRMLLCTKGHFIRDLDKVLAGEGGHGSEEERKRSGEEMLQRIRDYASDETGHHPGSEVWSWHASREVKERRPSHPPPAGGSAPKNERRRSSHSHRHHHSSREQAGELTKMVDGKPPRKHQRIIYVDGGFDLFSSGHIEFLRRVSEDEEALGKQLDWYTDEARQRRIEEAGEDYPPYYLIAGVHDDEVINHWKGINYPIMNIFERGLCVLQCKYVHALIFSAPFTPTKSFLAALPYGPPHAVYHGPTSFMPLTYDPYTAAKELGIFVEIPSHEYAHVNAGEIVERILKGRTMYEARQRMKGVKSVSEDATRKREVLEAEAKARAELRELERTRSIQEIERGYGL